MAFGQTTVDQLREWALAGDFEQIERRLSLAHMQNVRGEISYDALRQMVDGVAVTHPDIVKTVDAWLLALPQSPYANSVRARQLFSASWGWRGDGFARDTNRDAAVAFSQAQYRAMEHAVVAYEQAPDFVPASDMILLLQPTTSYFSRYVFLGILSDIMERTPNVRSLRNARFFTVRGWRGRGASDINLICETHADSIPDESFDVDVCKVLFVGNRAPREVQASGLDSLGDRYHPSLDYQRAWYITNAFDRPRTDAERQIIHDYLQGDGNEKVEIAERYMRSFPRTAEMEAVLVDVAIEAKEQARDTLVHDPYNIDAIETVLLRGLLLSTIDFDFQRDVRRENTEILNARLAVARPFDSDVWLNIARGYSGNYEYAKEGRAMPFYQNAIFYSDHEPWVIEATQFHMMDVLGYAHYERNPSDPVIKITSDLPQDVVCEFVRLDRILNHQCRSVGEKYGSCPSIQEIQPDYSRFVSEANATGLCSAVISSSIADLKYQPTQVLLDRLAQPLDWD